MPNAAGRHRPRTISDKRGSAGSQPRLTAGDRRRPVLGVPVGRTSLVEADELLAHVSPAQSENIGLFGTITVDVDIDHELAQLDPTGYRPLRRPPATTGAT